MRTLAAILILLMVLPVPALAVDTEGLEQALPESAREILGDASVAEASGGGLWQRIGQWALSALSGHLSAAARSAAVALAVTLLCSLASSLGEKGGSSDYVILGGALAIMAACAGDMKSFLGQTQQALLELSDFSKALLPTVAASAAASGHGAAAAARYAASALFLDVMMGVGLRLILPCIYAYAAASTAHAALPSGAK